MPPKPRSPKPTTFTSYFVPGYMISRQVMFNKVHQFLGPEASVRTFIYQRREGYLINSPGGPLTKNQIEDLQDLSQSYEQQEAARMARASGLMNPADFYINKPIPVQQRHREGAAQPR